MNWLVITVGGSHQPIVKSIETLKPARIVFVCSPGSCNQITGEGNVCIAKPGESPSLSNIPTLANLSEEQYKPYIVGDVNPDDISDCYEKMVNALDRIHKDDPTARIFCDYTGGTKSMSAALVLAALDDYGTDLNLTTGVRNDLIKVKDGTEIFGKARVDKIRLRLVLRSASILLEKYHYASAAMMLNTYLMDYGDSPGIYDQLCRHINYCRAFDAWDRFDHTAAYELLKAVGGSENSGYLAYLGRINKESVSSGWETEVGYMLALDLLNNAERRASQDRYDDAIARHYRAVELVIQTLLCTKYGIQTAEVRHDQIPDDIPWKEDAKDAPIAAGLMRSWELASALNPDINQFFKSWRNKLLNALSSRNMSIGAHGTRPAAKSDYLKDKSSGMGKFVAEAVQFIQDKNLIGQSSANKKICPDMDVIQFAQKRNPPGKLMAPLPFPIKL